jgi:capsular exopolysaccharide synthesis family protein
MSDLNTGFENLEGNSNSSSRLKGIADYLLIIRDRWLIGIALALPVAFLYAYVKLGEPPMYQSRSSMMLEPGQSIINMQKVVRDDYSAAILGIHLERMKSRTLLQNVIAAIEKNPNRRKEVLAPYIKDLDPAAPQPSVAGVVSGSYSISLGGQGAPIISIYAISGSGKGAAVVSNTVMEEYLKLLSVQSSSTYDAAIAFLEDQKEEMQMKELEVDRALKDFRKKHNITSIEGNREFITARISALSGAVTGARMDRITLQTELQQVMAFKLSGKDIFELSSISGFGNVEDLRSQLVELMTEHSRLKDRYLEKHPKLVDNLRQIDSINDLLDMQVEQAISDLKNKIKMAELQELEYKNELRKGELEASNLDELSIQYNAMKRQQSVYNSTFQQLIQRLNEARITSQLESRNLKQHEEALDGGHISPDRRKIMTTAMGIFAAVFIGLPLGLELIDNRVKSPWDVEVFLGRDLLAGIPRISDVKESDRPLIVGNDLDEGLVEAFRSLYSRIQMQSEISGSKSMLVTSAIPSEGKSLLAANLAYTFANHGRKTVLVDFDLRRPGIHKFCGLENDKGLLTLVEEYENNPLGLDAVNLDEVMKEVFPNLYILPSGGRTRSATEMLEKPAFDAVINMLKKHCDILMLDTSPIGLFPDSLALAQKTDELVYVTRFGKVSRKVCKELLNSLENTGTRILGVVLNDLPEKKAHGYYYYGGYYGYGYYRYKYYNKYYGGDDKEDDFHEKMKERRKLAMEKAQEDNGFEIEKKPSSENDNNVST